MPATAASRKEDTKAQNRKRTALELYLKDISYNTLLTPQQEFDLAVRIRSGDRKSLEKMVESNLRFVITIAKEYQSLYGESLRGRVSSETSGWYRSSLLAQLPQ